MRYILKNIVFVFLSILFFTSSVLIYRYFIYKKPEVNVTKEDIAISKKVQEELKYTLNLSHKIAKVLEANPKPSFSKLLLKSKYPFFIFRDKKLLYWSDYKFQPSYENVSGVFTHRFAYLKNGKFIIQKQTLVHQDEVLEICIFIPLTFRYAIENNYVHSRINSDIFNVKSILISNEFSSSGMNIYSPKNEFLFSILIPQPENSKNLGALVCIVIFVLLSLLCLIYYVVHLLIALLNIKKTGYALFILLIFLVFIRGLMLISKFPFSLIEVDLFNSKYFASSIVSPSLGDLLLNVLFFTFLSFFLFFIYYRTSHFKNIIIRHKNGFFVSLLITSLSFFFIYAVYYIFTIINEHSRWALDITLSIDFNLFRFTSIAIFILASINYFIFIHILCRVFIFFNDYKIGRLVYFLLIGCLIFSAVSYFYSIFSWKIIGLNVLYFFLVVRLKLPKYLKTLRYATYIYFLSAAGICSAAGAIAIFDVNLEKLLIQKNKFASQMLIESDVLGEYLLSEAQQKIEGDEFIKNRLSSLFSSKELIEQKIKKIFLSNYFEKYDVEVSLFDSQGIALNPNQEYQDYRTAAKELGKSNFRTEYNNVYFLNEFDKKGSRRYVVFNRIVKNNVTVGFILIQLINKRIIPNSVYPELLVDKKFGQAANARNFSFAIYSNNELLSNSGSVNYDHDFRIEWLNQNELYNKGISIGSFHHLGIKGKDGKTIVVSSEKYSLTDIFSNFSFLLLVFILFILLLLAFIAVYFKLAKIDATYTTKIQIYLNIAFFLPLFIVSVTTLSIISSSYKENLHRSFIKKAESASNNLSGYLEEHEGRMIRIENLQEVLHQMARYTESDINLFGNDGRLIFSSQPLIYDNGLLSGLINPVAYAEIKERRGNTVMLSELVGTLNYNSVYVAVKSFDTGKLLGILSIPFFESRQELERQVIDVLTTIINIFISIFILFLILSYFASRVLIIPLKLITYRIKRTSLGRKNEPIEWSSKDEIGLMVGEYNKMIVKLEQSKEALSKSEKESAWREMAQQIAHEIKNPLTPMKLTIQHLQRALQDKKEDLNEKIDKALQTLLTQVNNLNEIATSFSLFAKMPVPKDDILDITSLLQSIVSLYNNSSEALVISELDEKKFLINGDLQAMNGVFSNIIINAIQSVPIKIKPIIKVKSRIVNKHLLVEIKDNGSGIPTAIRDKVFIPNFSTKYAGSGIGLAVAKGSVEHAGGRIWFESEENNGTTFFIELPLIQNFE